ncbi:MAG: phosphoglucosamine mutase [Candidatus Hydrothermarchaeota archaeon]
MGLFGTSGIRAVVQEELTSEIAHLAGLSLGTYLNNQGMVLVGRDPRTSGEMIEHAVISGLLSSGCEVLKLGIVPTPTIALATKYYNGDAGVSITASHNPPEYNGIKFWQPNGMAYTPHMEEKIENIIKHRSFKRVDWSRIKGVSSLHGVSDVHINAIIKSVSIDNPLRVVIDCANGASSSITPYVLRKLGCDVITLNSQLDGHFPGRHPEPCSDTLNDLCKVVKSIGADVGIAHDGDGDRTVVVDERGSLVDFDKFLALVAGEMTVKNSIVVTNIDTSICVDEYVAKKGGNVIRTKVGDVHIAEAIINHGAVFGGEPSGSLIFPDVHLCPDGPLAGAKIVEIIDKSGESLSELVERIPSYPLERGKVKCRNDLKLILMNLLKEELPKRLEDIDHVDEIDGIRIVLKDNSWILVRPSGTEPYMRITVEAKEDPSCLYETTFETLKELLEKIG